MNKFDVVKVMDAGFRVFRLSYDGITITEASGNCCGWKKHGQYPTKAAGKRAFLELMKNPKHLEG